MKEKIIVHVLDESLKIPDAKFSKSEDAYKHAYNLLKTYNCEVVATSFLDEKCWGKITFRVNKKEGEKCPVVK